MSSATEYRQSGCKGIITGVCLGLLIWLTVLVSSALLVHFCVVPLAPWCGW